jgi:hypothetical protein
MGNSWNEHVAKFRESHPEMSFKAALKAASATYKKKHKKAKVMDEVVIKEDDYVK